MKLFRLPKYPQTHELTALNKRLQTGEIVLDWRDVVAPLSSIQLAILLQGLDLADNSDIIGIATIPEFLQQRVLDVLREQEKDETRRMRAAFPPSSREVRPAQWIPEGTQHDPDRTQLRPMRSFRDEAEIVSQKDDA